MEYDLSSNLVKWFKKKKGKKKELKRWKLLFLEKYFFPYVPDKNTDKTIAASLGCSSRNMIL